MNSTVGQIWVLMDTFVINHSVEATQTPRVPAHDFVCTQGKKVYFKAMSLSDVTG